MLLQRQFCKLMHTLLFSVYSPNVPPALQVLLDDLHGDPFLKADFILPLAGVRLYCHIFLLWRSKREKDREKEAQ